MAAEAANNRRRVEPDSKEPLSSLDIISCLPDEMLDSIISLLPTKSSARTTVLSKRWRHLRRSATLDLSIDHIISDKERIRLAIVYNIFSTHLGPVRRLSIGIFRTKHTLSSKFSKWFRSSAIDRLEELTFYGGTSGPRTLPWSVLCFAPTLRIQSLWYCFLHKIIAAPIISLPQLTNLELYDIFTWETAIQRMIASCTALEDLRLQGIYGFTSLQIISPNLHTIGVSFIPISSRSRHHRGMFHELGQLVIEDAPCLVRLIVLGPVSPRSIRVVSWPKLTLFGFVPPENSRIIGATHRKRWDLIIGAIPAHQRMIPTSSSVPSVGNMKYLAVDFFAPIDLDETVDFLECFHSREKLYIQKSMWTKMLSIEYHKLYPMNAMFCLSHCSTCSSCEQKLV